MRKSAMASPRYKAVLDPSLGLTSFVEDGEPSTLAECLTGFEVSMSGRRGWGSRQ